MYDNTVIHVFTNKCCNIKYNPNDTSSYWGIGDLIRGTIKLYQYSLIMKFNYYVDISLHPISKYLINSNHKYEYLVQKNKDNIEYFYIDRLKDNLKKKLKEASEKSEYKDLKHSYDDNIIMLTTNDKIAECLPITDECKNFILNIFKPKPEFKLYFDNYVKNILKLNDNYGICHFRLGDELLIKNENKLDIHTFLNKYIINDYISIENDILLTDNKLLKKYVLDNNIMITPNTIIKHLGLNNDEQQDQEQEHNGLNTLEEDYGTRDTLIEFFLILNSKVIKSYTSYNWISGFVFWISVVKDIPIIILEK